MRQAVCAFLITIMTPLAAQAAEPFSVPSSGVLSPSKSVAALYDSDSLTTGRPVATKGPIESASLPKVQGPKPKTRASAPEVRSSIAPYVRRSKRPAATLPPGVSAPQPYRPGMPPLQVETPSYDNQDQAVYAQPAPAMNASSGSRGFFAQPAAPATQTAPAFAQAPMQSRSTWSDLFSPGRRGGERGLFASSTAPAIAQPAVQQGQPSPIY